MFPLVFVFGGCCSNVLILEGIVHTGKLSSTLVTFAQFAIVASVSYWLVADPRKGLWIPRSSLSFSAHLLQTISFFVVNYLNNLVFQFDVAIPVHIILRSSGTPISMILGWLWFHKRYSLSQCMGALLITLGVILVTISTDDLEFSVELNMRKLIGVLILFFSTSIGCVIGLIQEGAARRASWRENLFFTHLYGLPLFMLFARTSLLQDISVLKTLVSSGDYNLTRQLVFNCVTQFVCVYGVNVLASTTSALTVSITLLLRKFASLLISMYVFGNIPSQRSAVGIVLVFGGALVYANSTKKKLE